MKNLLRPLLLAVLFTFPFVGTAQTTRTAPDEAPDYARVRGITYLYIDVSSSDNSPSDSELRNEMRDIIELELRRANVIIKTLLPTQSPDTTPMLHFHLKFDRGMGRYACNIRLNVRDQVNITRNREQITAITFEVARNVSATSDAALAREIKLKTRELIGEFITGLKKVNS
ncbi:MAG: hypothetical protein LBV12_12795 [Puniceicoccales bacterium]|jgi:hypothetical protein|nr:hypothetical protein [Puniceicoccales bacterium]